MSGWTTNGCPTRRSTDESRIALQECRNKIHITVLVQEVESILSAEGKTFDLVKLADQCYDLGAFPALWAVEGLGHFYGETVFGKRETPRALLTCDEAQPLPAKTLTMLHAGIGLSFAKHALGKLSKNSSETEIGSAVEQFLVLCRESSRVGYVGAAIESLGLVSRFLHGAPMVKRIDLYLRQAEPSYRGYLWHGVGRAVYFSPSNFIPGVSSPWRGVSLCRTEAVDERALANMVAGFGWAVTLVNMRTSDIESFLKFQPQDSSMADIWSSLVGSPCRAALEDYHPALKQSGRLEEVFHYQPLGELTFP